MQLCDAMWVSPGWGGRTQESARLEAEERQRQEVPQTVCASLILQPAALVNAPKEELALEKARAEAEAGVRPRKHVHKDAAKPAPEFRATEACDEVFFI